MTYYDPSQEDMNYQEGFDDPNQIIEIPLDDEMQQQAAPTIASQLPLDETNLAEDLEEEELKEIAEKAIKDYENAL